MSRQGLQEREYVRVMSARPVLVYRASDELPISKTAQGSLNDVTQMLQRVRELAVQYANGTTSTTDQVAIQSEVNQLVSEINRVGETTQFNGVNLLSGATTISFQVGANDGEVIAVTTITLSASVGEISLTSISGIDAALSAVSAAAGDRERWWGGRLRGRPPLKLAGPPPRLRHGPSSRISPQ